MMHRSTCPNSLKFVISSYFFFFLLFVYSYGFFYFQCLAIFALFHLRKVTYVFCLCISIYHILFRLIKLRTFMCMALESFCGHDHDLHLFYQNPFSLVLNFNYCRRIYIQKLSLTSSCTLEIPFEFFEREFCAILTLEHFRLVFETILKIR